MAIDYDETLPPERLRGLIAYDQHTGKMQWRGEGLTKQNRRFAGQPCCNTLSGSGYYHGQVLGREVRAHRLIWALHYGVWPHVGIDHINGDKTDNRIANLRQATVAENLRNRKMPRHNTSGHFGVHRLGRKWRAAIGFNSKIIYLGTFDDLDGAIAARRAAERQYGFHENHGRQKGPSNG